MNLHIWNERTRFPPVEAKKPNSLGLFWNFGISCLLSMHINSIEFTYDKFKSAKFGFRQI